MPADGDLAQALKAIGSIAALDTKVEIFIEEFKRERDIAATHRKDLREVIGSLGEAVRTLASQFVEVKPLVADVASQKVEVASLAARLLVIEPIVKDYVEKRAERRGQERLAKFLWAGTTFVISVAVALIVKKI